MKTLNFYLLSLLLPIIIVFFLLSTSTTTTCLFGVVEAIPERIPVPPQFVADIEVSWRKYNKAAARVFVQTGETGTISIVTPNRTEYLFPPGSSTVRVRQCAASSSSRTTSTSNTITSRNIPITSLDMAAQMLIHASRLLIYPSDWDESGLVRKQLGGVPVDAGSDECYPYGTSCECMCHYAFDDETWVAESPYSLRGLKIDSCTSSCFPDTFVSVLSFWQTSIPPAMLIQCDSASSSTSNGGGADANDVLSSTSSLISALGGSNNNNGLNFPENYNKFGNYTNAFPLLPDEFNALFKVTLIEYGVNMEFHEIFSGPLRASRTTVYQTNTVLNNNNLAASAFSYLTQGTAAVTYRVEHEIVLSSSSGTNSYGTGCQRMIYGEPIFASSVHRLLAVPGSAPPVYVGRYTVRGIECKLFTQRVSNNLKVDWYFDAGISRTSPQLPRRIVLRGRGQAPFFTNHPFAPKNVNLQSDDADLCDQHPFFFNPHCAGVEISSNMQYQHVVDIAELSVQDARNYSVFSPPTQCYSAPWTKGSTCDGVSPGVVVFLSLSCVILGGALTRCCCWPKPGSNKDLNEENEGNVTNNNAYSPSPSSSPARRQQQEGELSGTEQQRYSEVQPVPLPTSRL